MISSVSQIQEVIAIPQEYFWLPWAVQYFFFIGIACCATLYACWQCWKGRTGNPRLEAVAVFIAVTAGITAPLALTADLHQTARVWHFYAYPTPWSWMAWGSLLLPLFSAFSILYFIAMVVRLVWKREYKLTRWVALACALTSIGLLLYTGREASILKARPVLYTYWLPILLFFSAMQVLPTLLALGTRREPVYQRELAMWFIGSLMLLAVCTGFWIAGDTISGQAIRQQLAIGSLGWWSAIGVIALWIVTKDQ